MTDELTQQIQDLVDRYEATDPADLPQPERDELYAAKIEADVRDKGAHQALADILEDATETTAIQLLANLGHAIKFGSEGKQLGNGIIQLARGYYSGWLRDQVNQAAATSKARQQRKMADLETDVRIHECKEANQ